MSTARENAEAALAWFDSINGDRDGGRVLIRYNDLAALLAETAPTEWEYGCANFGDLDDVMTVPGPLALQGKTDRQWVEGVLQPEYGDFLVRRRKAGPWEPVDATPKEEQ